MTETRRQSGISLVEILVALAVSAILLAGVVQLFLSTKQTYNTMEGLARLQEDGRFGLEFMATDIRMAGYYGCNGRQLTFTNQMADAGTTAENFYRFQITEPLEGFEATAGAASWTPDPVAAGAIAAAPGLVYGTMSSDVLAVRLPLGDPLALTANAATGASAVTVDTTGLQCPSWLPGAGDVVIVSDCQGSHLLQVEATTDDATCPNTAARTLTMDGSRSDPGNAGTAFNRDYTQERTEVMRMVTRVYFVDDLDGDGVPSLYRRTDAENPVELVPGVESMQVRYGVDTGTDGFANAYQDADTVAAANDWDRVAAVRIALLVRTLDPVKGGAEAQQHCMLGDPLAACAGGEAADSTNTDTWTDTNDGFIHKVYTSTIVFRNRAPVSL